MKKIILILLVITSLFAGAKFHDLRLLHYPQARPWLQDADRNPTSMYNIGWLYYKTIKDIPKAIIWFKKAYKVGDNDIAGSAASNLGYIYDDLKEYKKAKEWYKKGIDKGDKDAAANLGLLYKKLHKYDDAILYYKKAYTMGNIDGAYALGYFYDVTKHDFKNAIIWYKKAAKNGHVTAIKNLAYVYRDMHDNLISSAYLIALIPNNYSKDKIFNRLRNIWKIDEATIKKAYQLQKTLDIPKHYYDPEFEDKPMQTRHGRR